ncbi:MAG: hypothetical protein WC340_08755 [Kiritimatiellia bacterium]
MTRLLGDVCEVVQTGNCSIVWNVGADWSENLTQVAKPKVTAWSTNSPPQVMVIDLSKGTAATKEEPYPVFYYSSLDALPGGGLSNAIYKTSMSVMHKIPSGISPWTWPIPPDYCRPYASNQLWCWKERLALARRRLPSAQRRKSQVDSE